MLKAELRELIPLQHIAWCNLINPDARLQFLRDLIAVVWYLSDGNMLIWYLRRDGGNVHIHMRIWRCCIRHLKRLLIHEKRRNGGMTLQRIMCYDKESFNVAFTSVPDSVTHSNISWLKFFFYFGFFPTK